MSRLAERIGGERRVIGGPFGSNLTQADYQATGVPVIRGSNMEHSGRWIGGDFAFVARHKADQSLKSNMAQPGDIVVTQRGTLGQVSIIPQDGGFDEFVISQSQMAVSVDTRIASRDFVYYYLKSPQFAEYLEQSTIQTGVPHINLGILRNAPAHWPSLDTQRAIARVLARLDAKIELNRRTNETLETMAQAIFRDWFVDFGPVRRKMAGAADPVAVMGGLTPDPARAGELAALFPESLDDTGVPHGWGMTTLAEYSDLNSESWSARNRPANVRYVDLSNTKWGVIESTAEFAWDDAPSRARRVARKGDTLVGTVRPGNGSYAFVGEDGLTASTGFALLRPKASHFEDLVYIAATLRENIDRLALLADGGAYPAVNPSLVLETEAPKIRADLARSFSDFASPIRTLVEGRKAENRTLAETRDYLLPRLMSGEVRVTEPDIEVAA